ncbi:hypothetical protein IPA_01535 [Ignicoccus pacificus DSM 13166]|uniref:DUF4258 domain-containing protein n=1 Tax=Ignicoccus pacificus DSM 13166 TaxID=940294 RepID=A0A977KAJ4_9CREN|nr:hypothetical protein IPA_01535 [Ignicoccus pacificus DSM 13166]
MKVKFTNHAEDRIRKYGLNKIVVVRALLEPDCVIEGKLRVSSVER